MTDSSVTRYGRPWREEIFQLSRVPFGFEELQQKFHPAELPYMAHFCKNLKYFRKCHRFLYFEEYTNSSGRSRVTRPEELVAVPLFRAPDTQISAKFRLYSIVRTNLAMINLGTPIRTRFRWICEAGCHPDKFPSRMSGQKPLFRETASLGIAGGPAAMRAQ